MRTNIQIQVKKISIIEESYTIYLLFCISSVQKNISKESVDLKSFLIREQIRQADEKRNTLLQFTSLLFSSTGNQLITNKITVTPKLRIKILFNKVNREK